jgi:asparagine synthase (glutamine-hydrolysing)
MFRLAIRRNPSIRYFSTSNHLLCGLIASIGSPLEKITVQNALQTIKHRGPDDQSYWADSKVMLGHVRLSIIDPTPQSNQPLHNHKQTLHCVVNGELYDYEHIRDDLIKRGHHFKTKSDSEIVMHLYEQYGTDMFRHLTGEFSFVIYDSQRGIVIACRDRFGIKPLLYATQNNTLMFASEAKALFAMGVDNKWNVDACVTRSFWLGNDTPFKGIYNVPPAHYMVVKLSDPTHINMMRYWDADYCTYDKETRNDVICAEEMIHNVRSLFDDAVRKRLRSDVPVGVYLSGGIDSCSVLGVTDRILREKNDKSKIDAFTIAFTDHKDFDESGKAKLVVDQYQGRVNYHQIDINQADIADAFEKAIYHAEIPTYNCSVVGKHILARGTNDKNCKVVLTGEGSDEVFSGYMWFKSEYLRLLEPSIRESIAKTAEKEKLVTFPFMTPTAGTGVGDVIGHDSIILSQILTLANKVGPVPSDVRYGLYSVVPPEVIHKMKHVWHPIHTSMYLWSKTFLPYTIIQTLGDRAEMSYSVEGRVPFLDHHLVDYVNSLPIGVKMKFDGTRVIEKYILREALKDVLPDDVYKREKFPFNAPPSTWFAEGKLYNFFQETLRGDSMKNVPFYDHKEVIKFLNLVHESKNSAEPTVLQGNDATMIYLACFAVMQKMFNLK